jgi:hypothetical protein
MTRPAALLLCLLVASCGTSMQPNASVLPPGLLGVVNDTDLAAINLVQYNFADANRTYGDPAEAAKAVAALDYMAGELSVSPRWVNLPYDVKQNMLDARVSVRAALGIAPDAPSQALVDAMATVTDALSTGHEAAAEAALVPPTFTLPPAETLRRLANMPYIQVADAAADQADDAMNNPPQPNRVCVDCTQYLNGPISVPYQ